MKHRFLMAGVVLLTACLAGWVALANAQPAPLGPPSLDPPGVESPAMPPPANPGGVPSVVTPPASPPNIVPPVAAPAAIIPNVVPPPPPAIESPPFVPSSPLPAPPAGIAEERPVPKEMTPAPVGMLPPVGAGPATSVAKPAPVEKIEPPREQLVGRQEPGVSLEWIGPPVVKVGQPGDYSLVVRNLGNNPVTDVVVRVAIPPGLGVRGVAPQATDERGKMAWDLGTLLGKQERVIQLKLQPETRGESLPQAWVTFTGSAVLRVRVREPRLALKCSVANKILVGDPAAFTLTVSNPGDGLAERIKIRANLSDGLEHARGNKIDFEIGDLAAGEARNVTLLCATRAGGAQKCEAVVEAENGPSARDAASLEVVTPRLDLKLGGPHLRYLDRKAIYSLEVTNPGDAVATNVTVAEVVPAGFKVLAASDGGRHDSQTRTVSWFLGEVGPGQTRVVKLEVQAECLGEFKHKAAAFGARGLRADSELVTRVLGLTALLVEVVDTEDPIEAGGETSYEVRITNTGSKTETDLKLVAVVPDKMEFKNATGPARFRVEGKAVVFEPLEKLAPRADAVFRINVKALTVGQCLFQVQVRSADIADPVVKFEATQIYSDTGVVGSGTAPTGIPPAPPAPAFPAPSPVPAGILPASGASGVLPRPGAN